MTRNVVKIVIRFDAKYLKRVRREVVNGPIMWPASLRTWIATDFGCQTERKSREDLRQMPYPETY